MTRGLDHIPNLPDGWKMWVYNDEVTWYRDDLGYPIEYWVCQYPFVPGFFVAVTLDDDHTISSYPIAGPFKTVFDAVAAINLIQT